MSPKRVFFTAKIDLEGETQLTMVAGTRIVDAAIQPNGMILLACVQPVHEHTLPFSNTRTFRVVLDGVTLGSGYFHIRSLVWQRGLVHVLEHLPLPVGPG